jgi:hypothetical protein
VRCCRTAARSALDLGWPKRGLCDPSAINGATIQTPGVATGAGPNGFFLSTNIFEANRALAG